MNYLLHVLIYFEIYAIAALGLNLVVGYCGILTLCHASYIALGAYAYALATRVLGAPFPAAVASAIAIGAVASLAVSLPARRLRGDFLVLGTLAVQSLVLHLLNNWSDVSAPLGSLANLTNGPFGIASIPPPAFAGRQFTSLPEIACIDGLALAACLAVARRLHESPWKRALVALRDDEVAAAALGKDALRLRVGALAVGCGLASTAGALYAAYVGYVEPGSGDLDQGILMLSMVLVGGAGNLRGPLAGAAALILLPEILRLLALPDSLAANVRLAVFGLLLMWIVHARPRGLAGETEMA